MKISLNRKDMISVIPKIQTLAGKRATMAMTGCILIQTMDNGILISATDLDTGFEGFYPAEIEESGTIAINARRFCDIIRVFPEEILKIEEQDNRWVEISCDQVEYHLPGMDPVDFPAIPEIDGYSFITMEASVFRKMIERTATLAYLPDERREFVLGVFFEIIREENLFRMVSTDIRRLVKVDTPFQGDFSAIPEEGILIKKRSLMEIVKFIDDDGEIRIGVKGNNIVFQMDNETIVAKLMDGSFPEYKNKLIFDPANDVKLPRENFLSMLKRMVIFTSEEYRAGNFIFENNELTIHVNNQFLGEAREEMDIEYGREENIQAYFNIRFIMDAAEKIESETILFNIERTDGPCIMRGEGDESFLVLIMPMRFDTSQDS